MSVEEIKREIASLSAGEKRQVAEFLSELGREAVSEQNLDIFLRERLAQATAGEFSARSVSEIWQEVRSAR
jgi:hypothetical protein